MKKFFFILAVFLSFMWSAQAFAEREDPGIFLERMFREGSEELAKEQTIQTKFQVVRKFLELGMDLPEIGVKAIGKLAKAIPPKAKNDYIDKFVEYFFHGNKAVDKLANASELKFKHNPKTKNVDGDYAKVSGTLSLAGQNDLNVWFSLRWDNQKSTWLVTDIGIESLSSAVVSYKTEFNDCMQGDPVHSMANIMKYLDCRMSGNGEAQCRKNESSSTASDR